MNGSGGAICHAGNPPNSRGASAYHGGEGPLSVSDPRHKSAMTTAFVEAAREWGMTANDDFNGQEQDGAGFYQLTQRAGRRWSAADAYLHPAAGRANLTIQTDSLVTGVEFEGGRAAGVRYLRRGTEVLARADGEVILLWTLPVLAIVWLSVFLLFPGFVPPMSPTMSADEVAAFYRDPENLPRIRYSMIVFNWFAVGLIPILALIVMQIRRMAHRTPIFSYAIIACAAGGPTIPQDRLALALRREA